MLRFVVEEVATGNLVHFEDSWGDYLMKLPVIGAVRQEILDA